MPPIPQDRINALKATCDLPSLLTGQGFTLLERGSNLITHCPFHEDRTPSLILSRKNGHWLWHCMGACAQGGSAIQWVMRREGLPFREACQWLEDWVSLSGAPVPSDNGTEKKREYPPLDSLPSDEKAFLREVIDHYSRTLLDSEEATTYLKGRAIYDQEMIQKFKIGYCDRSLGKILAGKGTKRGKWEREVLEKVGLLRDSGYEHFSGCITVPVLDREGNVLEIYGRKIARSFRKDTPKHLYLPGPHGGVWNPACLETSEIILCESLIDGLTFYKNCFQNVTASYGTSGFSEAHLEAIQEHNTRRVYLAYDMDRAGEKGAFKVFEALSREGVECLRVHFPKGLDANAYAVKMQPAGKALSMALESAVSMKGTAATLTTTTKSSKQAGEEPLTQKQTCLYRILGRLPIKSRQDNRIKKIARENRLSVSC